MKKTYLAICMGLAISASVLTVNAAETTTEATATQTEVSEKENAEKSTTMDMIYGTVDEIKDDTIKLLPDTDVESQKDDLEAQQFKINEETPILSFSCEDFNSIKDKEKSESETDENSVAGEDIRDVTEVETKEEKEAVFAQISELLKTSDLVKLEDTLEKEHNSKEITFSDLKTNDYAGVVIDQDGTVQAIFVIPETSEDTED